MASKHGSYESVSSMARTLHRSLAEWCQERLRDAGQEHIRVLGHFQPQGSSEPSVVIFPYRITPFPRLLDNTAGVSLMGNWMSELPSPEQAEKALAQSDPGVSAKGTTATRIQRPSRLIPTEWLVLGQAFRRRLEVMLEDYQDQHFGGSNRRHPASKALIPATLPLKALPKPLQAWYRDQIDNPPRTWERGGLLSPRHNQALERWVVPGPDGEDRVKLPFVSWVPGFDVALYYLVVGQGEVRRTGDWRPVDPPLSLPALAVITAAVQLEREIDVDQTPYLIPPRLVDLIDAIDHVAPRNRDEPSLMELYREAEKPRTNPIALRPVHDLSNQEFSLLMQALQRPLEPAVNLALHMRMGLGPRLVPGSLVVPRSIPVIREPKRYYAANREDEGGR